MADCQKPRFSKEEVAGSLIFGLFLLFADYFGLRSLSYPQVCAAL